jgi:hypothetical protein
MTNSTDLERRYRRLLAFYPQAFRREREDEVISVLLAGATEGQQRPRLGETIDLVANGIRLRLRPLKRPTSWELRHPAPSVLGRIFIGIWLAVLTAFVCQSGSWWGLTLLLPAGLQFYLGFRVAAALERDGEAGGPPSVPPPAVGA